MLRLILTLHSVVTQNILYSTETLIWSIVYPVDVLGTPRNVKILIGRLLDKLNQID
jgi:hypothetical protein